MRYYRNNTIGSIYGRISGLRYNSGENMMILDTGSKSWIENRTLITEYSKPGMEGVTAQTSVQKNGTPHFAYFFGGYGEDESGTSFAFTKIDILNLQNNTWLNVDTYHKEKDESYATPRSYANSAILLDKYLVIQAGKMYQQTSTVVSDLDVILLPTYDSENNFQENQSGSVEVVYVPSIAYSTYSNANSFSESASTSSFFITLFCVTSVLLLGVYILVQMSRSKRGIFSEGVALPFFLWHRRLVYD